MTATPPDHDEREAICLRCSGTGVPVIYGMPDAQLLADAEAGLVTSAGCVVPDDVDVWTCPRCGELWSVE